MWLAPPLHRSGEGAGGWGLLRIWEPLALLAVLAISAAFNVVGLEREAFANTYYAAAVKSMLTSWSAFFFASFDSGDFVTVDKPPVGLWVQALSAKLFGFSGLSLLLPQAIAGVLSVAVLYWLVRRAYGPGAGFMAALALAVTPIAVVTNRNNTMDAQLVLVLLLAAWAVTLAAERGRLRLLLLGAALMGLAYNIKMLQAYLVLPALWCMYLCWAPLRLRTRLTHLTAATVVLLVVSLSWSVAVDLMPADSRPYIGSSGSNSALSLSLGYNGLGRLTSAIASRLPIPWLDGLTVDLTAAPGFAPGIGDPGPLRLLSDGLAGQTSWLLPLAVMGLILAGCQLLPRPLGPARLALSSEDRDLARRRRVALTLWGLWLAGCGGYFSVARFYHIYYLIMLGPGVAALAGIGMAAGRRWYRQGGYRGWLLPTVLAISALVQARVLVAYLAWSGWLLPLVLGGCGVAAVTLLVTLLFGRAIVARRVAALATALGCLSLLAAPTVWSAVSVQNNNGAAWLPQAGPPGGFGFRGGAGFDGGPMPSGGPGGFGGPGGGPRGGGQGAMTFAGDQWNSLDPGLVQYLLANQGSARFLVATPTSSYASLFILATDQPAMALGGYQGWDRIVTLDRLSQLVQYSVVRFFWINGGRFAPSSSASDDSSDDTTQAIVSSSQDATGDLLAWVRESCAVVAPDQWQATDGETDEPLPGRGRQGPGGRQDPRGYQLYDCGALTGQP